MILGVHHAAITVDDLDAALTFYCETLGFEIAMESELPPGIEALNAAMGLDEASCKVRMIKKGNSCLELFEFGVSESGDPHRPVNRLGLTHIALASDKIEEDYDELSSRGVVFNAPLLGGPPSRFAYGRDPFGNVIELLEHDPEAPSGLDFGV